MKNLTINEENFPVIEFEDFSQTARRLKEYIGGGRIASDIFHEAVKNNRDKWRDKAFFYRKLASKIKVVEGDNDVTFEIDNMDGAVFCAKINVTIDEYDKPINENIGEKKENRIYIEIEEAAIVLSENEIVLLSENIIAFIEKHIKY